jgi:hypothetical protein
VSLSIDTDVGMLTVRCNRTGALAVDQGAALHSAADGWTITSSEVEGSLAAALTVSTVRVRNAEPSAAVGAELRKAVAALELRAGLFEAASGLEVVRSFALAVVEGFEARPSPSTSDVWLLNDFAATAEAYAAFEVVTQP